MLKEILSISGKPGLFKLISKGKNMFVAESLIDQKRIPVYSKDKVVSLGDITVYADNEDVPLKQILNSIKKKENAGLITFSPANTPEELRTYFAQVLPDFDRERVYPSDIKKILNWYNLLINSEITEFEEEEKKEENEDDEKKEENENNENNQSK